MCHWKAREFSRAFRKRSTKRQNYEKYEVSSISKKKKEKLYNKYLINLVCSIRTVSYGLLFFSLMARALHAWAIRVEKTRVHNLRYGPRTRLIRGIYWLLLQRESLGPPDWAIKQCDTAVQYLNTKLGDPKWRCCTLSVFAVRVYWGGLLLQRVTDHHHVQYLFPDWVFNKGLHIVNVHRKSILRLLTTPEGRSWTTSMYSICSLIVY